MRLLLLIFSTYPPGQPHLFLFLPKGGFHDAQNIIASRLQVRLHGGANPLGIRAEGWDHSERWASFHTSSEGPSHS